MGASEGGHDILCGPWRAPCGVRLGRIDFAETQSVTPEPLHPPHGTSREPSRSSAPSTSGRPHLAVAAGPEARDPVIADAHLAAQGDTDAFRRLIEAFQDRVFRVVIAVLHCDRSAAEDVCQEVFLRVWRGLPAFDGQNLHAWIHTIATNHAITEYRARRAQKRAQKPLSIDAPIAGTDDLFLDPASRERDPGDLTHQREFLARVRSAVHELPDEFRDPVVLRDLEGLSYEQIAEVLSLAPGTVRSRIHRGRLLLQQMLKGFQP